MNVTTLVEDFLTAQDGCLSKKTLDWYRVYLRPLEERYGGTEIDRVTLQQLRELFREQKKKDTLSDFSVFNFVRAWKRLFRWATQERHLSVSPAAALKLPPLPKKSPAGILEDDVETLLKVAEKSKFPERDKAIILFLTETGARVGGVTSLGVFDVDLDKKRATVMEKGKAGKVERLVFFTDKTASAINEWLDVRPFSRKDLRMFYLTETGIYQLLKRLARSAKIENHRWNPHSFRHGFARRMLSKGASLGVVSHFMGHSTVQVTQNYYGRFADDELQDIYNEIAERPAKNRVGRKRA